MTLFTLLATGRKGHFTPQRLMYAPRGVMNLAIPAWIAYLAAVVIPVLVLVINPASAWVNRWLSSVSIYPTLESSKTQSVSLNGAELSSDERLQFIQAWNQAIYLTERSEFTGSTYNPISIRIKEESRTFSLTAFLLGEGKIQLIRHLRRRNITFQVFSQALEEILCTHVERQSVG